MECQSWKGKWGTQQVKCLLMGYQVIHLLKSKSDMSTTSGRTQVNTLYNTVSLSTILGLKPTDTPMRSNSHSQHVCGLSHFVRLTWQIAGK